MTLIHYAFDTSISERRATWFDAGLCLERYPSWGSRLSRVRVVFTVSYITNTDCLVHFYLSLFDENVKLAVKFYDNSHRPARDN